MSPLITAILGPILEVFGRLIPDPEKKAAAQMQLMQMAQNGELAQLAAALQVITAEANGNFLQRSWRPIMMLFFMSLVGARWFGFSAPNMSEAEVMELWAIIKLGIGGYTLGRSAEKIVPALAGALQK